MKTPTIFITLLLASLASLATPVSAMPPTGRQIIGTIQKVDAKTQEIALLREDKGTVITFVWTKRTSFVADAKQTDASIVKKGEHVKVTYHVPFFGKPFVTRVMLSQASPK